MTNRLPDYKGTIQRQDEDNTYVKIGEAAFWKNEPNGKNNPELKGNVTIDGKTYTISLWSHP